MRSGLLSILLLLWLVVSSASAGAQAAGSKQTIEGVQFDAGASLLDLTPDQQSVAYRNIQLLAPTRRVYAGGRASTLLTARTDLSGVRYTFQGQRKTFDMFMDQTRVAGILVLKDGKIVYERYTNGHGEDRLWTGFSVAKSVVSLLFGAALMDGSIKSLDEKVTKFLPELKGSAYDDVTLENLIQMSSGVAWKEDELDPNSDLSRFAQLGREGLSAQLAYMRSLRRRAPAGSVFNYNTGETTIAGAVLRSATGRSLADYLTEKIWKPAGMEHDAYWMLIRPDDSEFPGCCLSASLRDYGRLGLLVLNNGVAANGRRILPRSWIEKSTSPAPTAKDYGYMWWLEGKGRFSASGIFGQYIFVDPSSRIVLVLQSYWPNAWTDELSSHRRAFVEGLLNYLESRPKALSGSKRRNRVRS